MHGWLPDFLHSYQKMKNTKQRFLFYLGHPAHFHLFKNVILNLKQNGCAVKILIKKKDILEELLQKAGFEYVNINPGGRADNKFAIAWALLKRDGIFIKHALQFRPQLMIGTSAEIAHTGTLLRIPSIVVNEDDANVVPLFAKLAYPFASHVLAPDCCEVGKWNRKKISYNSYHELAYLHPNHFAPDRKILDLYKMPDDFFIIRFAKLTAHHDEGRKGIDTNIAQALIDKLKPHGRVYITSERELEPQFEQYRISINPLHIHDVMAFAKLYIGDSQTMAAEAAVLGTPAIRFNDFVGEIGYLEELENPYQLTFGIRTNEVEKFYGKVDEILSMTDSRKVFSERLKKLLSEKIDASGFMTKLFMEYPASVDHWKKNRAEF